MSGVKSVVEIAFIGTVFLLCKYTRTPHEESLKMVFRTGAYPGWNGGDIAQLEAYCRRRDVSSLSAPEGGRRGDVDERRPYNLLWVDKRHNFRYFLIKATLLL